MIVRAWVFILLGLLLYRPHLGFSLPIGFGYNQGPLKFSEVSSPHFKVYFDSRVPQEGLMMIHALDAARPYVENWFGAARSRPLPVILSAVSDQASFANFITDALELQTLGQGPRSLVWHEYIHQAMYRTLDNFLGPAGNIIHLPWLPAWYIEGLADTLAVSVGSDTMAGIERYHALSGDWPSYARLHSLYARPGFALRGYATSAAFVRYILKKMGPNRLAEFLAALKDATMPWWWPYSIVPFVDSLPLDRVLKKFTGLAGEELYSEYQKAARDYWTKAPGHDSWLSEKKNRRDLSFVVGLQSRGGKLTGIKAGKNALEKTELFFDPQSGWAIGEKTLKTLPIEEAAASHALGSHQNAFVAYKTDNLSKKRTQWSTITVFSDKKTHTFKRRGTAYGLTFSKSYLYWFEQDLSKTQVCRIPRKDFPAAKDGKLSLRDLLCLGTETMPKSLQPIGVKYPVEDTKEAKDPAHEPEATEMWLRVSEEHLTGTLHRIKVLQLENGHLRTLDKVFSTDPLSVAFSGEDTWGLFATRNNRVLRKLGPDGSCLKEFVPKDHILDIQSSSVHDLAIKIYAGYNSYWRTLKIREETLKDCAEDLGPLSPIEAALARGTSEDLETDLKDADIWEVTGKNPASDIGKLGMTPTLEKMIDESNPSEVRPAKWRGRPVLLFPWIGAEDAFGPQLGIVSIPLMDHLQNETVRATLLYGIYSRFPYQDISVVSTRFIPTLNLGIFRQQTYNGRFIVGRGEERRIFTSFLEESGSRFEANWNFRSPWGFVSSEAGIKVSYLKPYIGPSLNGRGYLIEPSFSLGLTHAFSDRILISEFASARVAPPAKNHNFDYNQISVGTTLSMNLPLDSNLSLGLEGSRTRGKKMRDLREFYLPLKTFIPGSGGGYNRNSFPITVGESGGLFSPRFGDTQARARASWTLPLVRDFEKIFWIIYGERLDFTAFYNYGGAWNGGSTGAPSQGWKRLVGAHGYNIDLQMENKGVRFNSGIGSGQVVGRPFEIYVTTGFDAVF